MVIEESLLYQALDFNSNSPEMPAFYLQSSSPLYSPQSLVLLTPPTAGRIPKVKKKKKKKSTDLFKHHFPKCDVVIEGV